MDEDIEFHDELERVINARPFVPFSLLTMGGTRYGVNDENDVFFVHDTVTIVRMDRTILIRVYSIESIEIEEPKV